MEDEEGESCTDLILKPAHRGFDLSWAIHLHLGWQGGFGGEVEACWSQFLWIGHWALLWLWLSLRWMAAAGCCSVKWCVMWNQCEIFRNFQFHSWSIFSNSQNLGKIWISKHILVIHTKIWERIESPISKSLSLWEQQSVNLLSNNLSLSILK